jgi:glycosyltransferase involved in cell wall biosynthesis
MDIYLLSSLSEGTSMTLLEAMSLSKPCVVTDAGGNPEIVIDHENGFVTPNANSNKFAQGIIQTIELLKNHCYLGQTSKDIFNTHFSEVKMNKQYKQLYQQLVSR